MSRAVTIDRLPCAFLQSAGALAEEWRVDETEWPAFEAAYRRIEGLGQEALCREVSIDAVGEGFALLSGEWLEGELAENCLRPARRAWVYGVFFTAPLPESMPWAASLGETLIRDTAEGARRKIAAGEGVRLGVMAWRPELLLPLLAAGDSKPRGVCENAGILYTLETPACGGCRKHKACRP